MTRLLAILPVGLLLSVAAPAQCLGPATGTSILPGFVKWSSTAGYTSAFDVDDEGISNPPIALTAFPSFPMAGAVGNLDQIWVNSNGEIYLTDSTLGLLQPANGAQFGINTLAEMRGDVAGASARIAVCGADNEGSDVAGSAWDIVVDQTVPGEVKITWVDMARFANVTDQFSFGCTLYASGAVTMAWSANVPLAARYVGISIGNGVGTVTSPSLDLSAGVDSGTEGMLYQNLTTWDLSGLALLINPNGLGGYNSQVLCTPAFHANYGTGCYSYASATESFFQQWTTTAAASTTLTGNVMQLTPTGNGYAAQWFAGAATIAFVPPTGSATLLPTTDDGGQTITPSVPVPSPFGPSTQVTISHNGIITLAATGNQGTDFSPTGAEMAAATAGNGFYSWYDYNDAEATPVVSGRIKHEEIGNILYITWDGVEGYQSGNNPFTFQFQFDLVSGVVTYVWTNVNPVGLAGREYLVGYTDIGASAVPLAIDLPTALPITTVPDVTLSPLSLSASPAPVITLGGAGPSVPVTWTASNVVDIVPPFGIGLGLLLFSVAPIPGGIDAGFLDMPGCNLNIASLDVLIPFPGTAPVATLTLTIPQPLFPGLSFYSQALSLFTPGSLPNGQNLFGGILSNGVQSYFSNN